MIGVELDIPLPAPKTSHHHWELLARNIFSGQLHDHNDLCYNRIREAHNSSSKTDDRYNTCGISFKMANICLRGR